MVIATDEEIKQVKNEIIAKYRECFFRSFVEINSNFILDFFYNDRNGLIEFKTKNGIREQFEKYCHERTYDFLVEELLKKNLTRF